jgi:hypothetical protein
MPKRIQGSLAQPALGVDLVDIINTSDSFKLQTLRATLTTSAVVANRFPHFRIVNQNGDIFHEMVASTAQTASSTIVYDLCGGNGGAAAGTATVDGVASIKLPDFWLPGSADLSTVTTALDAGDQWSKIFWTALVGDEFEHLKMLQWIADGVNDTQ